MVGMPRLGKISRGIRRIANTEVSTTPTTSTRTVNGRRRAGWTRFMARNAGNAYYRHEFMSTIRGCGFLAAQGEFKNRRKSRSRRGYEAEVFFVPKSASLPRRLPFLNSPSRIPGRALEDGYPAAVG